MQSAKHYRTVEAACYAIKLATRISLNVLWRHIKESLVDLHLFRKVKINANIMPYSF